MKLLIQNANIANTLFNGVSTLTRANNERIQVLYRLYEQWFYLNSDLFIH